MRRPHALPDARPGWPRPRPRTARSWREERFAEAMESTVRINHQQIGALEDTIRAKDKQLAAMKTALERAKAKNTEAAEEQTQKQDKHADDVRKEMMARQAEQQASARPPKPEEVGEWKTAWNRAHGRWYWCVPHTFPQLAAWSLITQPLVGAQVACENDGNEVGRPEDSSIEMEP